MKKSLRFIGIVNYSLMLGFILSLCSGYAFHNERVVSTQSSSGFAGFHAIEATNFLSHTAEAESLVTSTVHAPSSSVKNPFGGFSLLNKSIEPFIGRVFSSNQYSFQNLVVRISHIDLIFPFHYFW